MSLRPFHETIVDAIKRCKPSPSAGEILHLHRLIMDTKIPSNHDAILEALRKYWDFPGSSKWGLEIQDVEKSLREQKQKHLEEQAEHQPKMTEEEDYRLRR